MVAQDITLPDVDHDHAAHVRDTDQLHDDASILGGSAGRGVGGVEIPTLEDFYGLTDGDSLVRFLDHETDLWLGPGT